MPHKDPKAAAEYFKNYNKAHAQERAIYRRSRKEHNKKMRRQRYLVNRDKNLEYARKWKLENPEYFKTWERKYYKLHPEKANSWHKKDPERSRKYRTEYSRKWRNKNRSKVQERIRARKARVKGNPSAAAFYKFVRSKKRIRCYYCGEWVSGKEAHIDHVIALAKDGNHASENLCCSCPKCNLKKHDNLPSETSFNNQPLLNL